MTIDKSPENHTEPQMHFYGRLVECYDVAIAIESGQLKTIEDVLKLLKVRAKLFANDLKNAGFFTGVEDQLGILNYCLSDKPSEAALQYLLKQHGLSDAQDSGK